ncbi:LuxR C-terminal-related transcriptional regulator [Enterobacter asburiae]|uniref:LuxR C-terminal-related transcriptional regulator n=1 Tax=unclassified Scandinavium TaxID=2830652 RepID=UPI0028A00994|nr:LuxR C-terminal-related transcriptional regulator [Scandinavium sp.]
MKIYTENYFLKIGLQTLLENNTDDNISNMNVLDLEGNLLAFITSYQIQNYKAESFMDPLHSYISLCNGVMTAEQLYRYITQHTSTPFISRKPLSLTVKEINLTNRLLAGYSVHNVAEHFQIKLKTVYGKKAQVENKLGVRNLSQLAMRLTLWERKLNLLTGSMCSSDAQRGAPSPSQAANNVVLRQRRGYAQHIPCE